MTKASWTVGVDLGGTKVDIGLVDKQGVIISREVIPTRVKDGPDAIVQDITSTIQKLSKQNPAGEITSIGVGMAGQIDKLTGAVHFAPNLGWHEFPLQAEINKALKLPVFVTNDVRAAVWGEWLYGAGQGCNDLLGIFIGTGIGGGVVSGGKMLLGHSNTAGEIGHMSIDLKGPACTCGNRGCFETFAAGWGIGRRAREVVAYDPSGGRLLVELAGGNPENITAKHLFEAYNKKLPLALKIMEEVQDALVAGVSSLVNVFNPAKVILGGGVIMKNPELIDVIRKGVPSRALKAATADLEIVEAKLKNDANVMGAAAFARQSASK